MKTLSYHYTTGNKLSLISDSGSLTPTNVMIAPQEKAVLWFSANTRYEPTAIKLISRGGQAYLPTVQELHELIGIFRFGLDAKDKRLIPFSRLPLVARISPHHVASMIASGMRIGAVPAHWTGALSPIALSELLFEEWNGEAWVPGSLPEAIERVKRSGLIVQSASAYELGLTDMY